MNSCLHAHGHKRFSLLELNFGNLSAGDVKQSNTRCRRSGGLPAVEAAAGHSVFPEAATMPGRHRGVRFISLLVARAAGAWAQRAANAAGLCEAVRQTPEERHGRR